MDVIDIHNIRVQFILFALMIVQRAGTSLSSMKNRDHSIGEFKVIFLIQNRLGVSCLMFWRSRVFLIVLLR